MSEIIDLALTQAIERYMEMRPEAVADAIAAEWPEQIATLLAELMFKSPCASCGGMADLIQFERHNGDSNYIVPLCGCDWDAR
jgi:hypothetical protein